MDLTCPKCRGAMRTYERSGVTVDQCTECRGIFLDRGELEKLVDAENSYHRAPAAAPAYGSPPDDRRHDDDREYREREYRDREYKKRDYDDDHRYSGDLHHYGKKHKRRSFLEELFD